jgi:hypothetical protein
MFMAKMEVLHLTPRERGELQSHLRKQSLPTGVALRLAGFPPGRLLIKPSYTVLEGIAQRKGPVV